MNPAPSSSWCLTCKYQLAQYPGTTPSLQIGPSFLWPKNGKVEGQAALKVEPSPNYCKLIAALLPALFPLCQRLSAARVSL